MTRSPLVGIRPEPGLSKTIARGHNMGLEVLGFPLFRAVPSAWDAPDPARFDGLLLGSANALRHGGTGLGRYKALPVYAVGEETAAATRDLGLVVRASGRGGLQALLDNLPKAAPGERLRLLRLAGAAHVPLDPHPGIEITTRVVYTVEALPLPYELRAILEDRATVLLHSGEAAAHFAAQCDAAAVPRNRIALAALAPRVAERAGQGWRRVVAAPSPDDAALLAAAVDLCQDGG